MATVWGADNVHRMIALFRSNEVLWWTNRKEYGKRGARFQALKKISMYLGGREKFSHMLFVIVIRMPC